MSNLAPELFTDEIPPLMQLTIIEKNSCRKCKIYILTSLSFRYQHKTHTNTHTYTYLITANHSVRSSVVNRDPLLSNVGKMGHIVSFSLHH